MTRRDSTLLFDFDGTVSLGSGPVLAYARAASAGLASAEADALLDALDRSLVAHPSGRVPETEAVDGYDLVRIMATARGVSAQTLSAAYLASRSLLATEHAEITAPVGLAEFLHEVRDRANLVLATNSPEIRIPEALDALGLGGLFDRVYTSVNKPIDFAIVLEEWMPRGPLMSIGDVWANDLAPARDRGAATALIGSAADAPREATPDLRADELHELYPALTAWLDSSPLHPLHDN